MNDNTRLPFSGSDIDTRIAQLSPEKRALLLKRLSRGNGDSGYAPVLRARSDQRTFGLSFAQQRLWFLDQLLPDKAAYNIGVAWRLRGRLDSQALQRSLDELVARHETLRTRFEVVEDMPVQIIDPPYSVALPIDDLSAMGQTEREACAIDIANEHACRPFDLEAGSLLRAQLLRLAADEHLLLLNIHHIVSDGWSASIVERELSNAYNAFVSGHEPRLPELRIQYADYALWQREWLQGEVLEEQLGYWKAKLADLPTLTLPTDRSRPPAMSYQGARAAFDLPAPLWQGLKELSRREGTTLFMTVLAAFQVLLYRYSGQEDIAVGSPIAGRVRTELEGIIGFFANTLVLRVDLSGNPPFRELLARVRECALGAYTHQDLPFDRLVEELAPTRDPSRNPLFQVLFALRKASGAELALEGVRASRVELARHTAKFDLFLSMHESAEGLSARWQYSTDLFDAQTIERMQRHLQQLLESIVDDPQQRIGELPLLSAAERHRLLVEWNDTAADYPRDRCIHELFEAQAARSPAAVAVVFEDRQLTYAELNARANQLAHHLIAIGVGPEVLVGICLERSPDLIIGLIAILKAGGAYVPLDPGYPKNRLAFMLEDAKARVVLTQQELLEQLPQFDGRILCLDRDCQSIATNPNTDPPCRASADSLAYVIYTSGSTGRPKGIPLSHATLVNLMAWPGQGGFEGRVAQLTSISFDVSLQEIFHALLCGRSLIVVDDDARLQPEKLAAFIRKNAISDLFLPNIVLECLAQAVARTRRNLPSLANVYQAGEALTITPVIRAFFENHPACRLHNHYGPAESHVVTAVTLPANPETWPYRPAIGSPISNTRVYILDRYQSPVPVGVVGELCIGGDGLTRGYLNRPELTAEKFLPDPFSPVAGARMYRTGDLVRYLPDGNIEYLGRIDDQVKIRGFRIELGEIETVLAEHPAVRQSVVLAREDTPGDKRLVAYVVPAEDSFSDSTPLRAFVRERLPEYMRPTAYMVLEALPLTPNGKVDRRALPVPPAVLVHAHRPQAAPRDEVERTLCAHWAETLGVECVGLDDNFFDIGGHSLLAASLFARLDRVFDRSLPLATLFEAPTIRELACFYRGSAEPANRSALVPITSGGSLPPLFAVSGVFGNVLNLADLARELGPEQPFFGLQSIGLDGACEPLESIEEIAALYLREIRQEQSHGPYHILGACFGSAVAYEMARQLLEADEEVAFLGLVDPSLLNSGVKRQSVMRTPAPLKQKLALAKFVMGRCRLYWKEIRALGFKGRVQFARDKARLVGEALRARDIFRGDRREFFQTRVADTNLRAMRRHKHQPLRRRPGAVEIFVSERRFDQMPTNARVSWNALSGRPVVFHRMPGKDSGDMIQRDNAKALATVLSVSLSRARAGNRPPSERRDTGSALLRE